ncbi:hypothetical protein [Clostridium sp. CF012]|uniref:hypothetical protein n=1 Tax=Clostridium sp. CF012 TaxID=2843319 RepID=UPI001C0B7368|nr:hypothetical protein [Clostridium sp. CF012]MBU3142161.1 hypothetical protein [Clostridium sp. CF012]
MTLNSINSIGTIISNYSVPNNPPQVKTDEMHSIELLKTNDYIDFSIDYTNDEASTILGNIKKSFDSTDYMSSNVSIVDCTDEYGKILKSIKTNSKFDDNTKLQLTKALDSSFDNFTEKKVKELGGNISNFFNKAYNIKEIYDKQGTNMGMKGDKLFNEEAAAKNVTNMLLSAKIFYKNNLNGTEDQFERFLQDKFSKTESIEMLSYNDFKSLQKAIVIVNDHKEIPADVSFSGRTKRQWEVMNNALESLKKDGASSIITNAFNKAVEQNNNSNKRMETYVEIRVSYEKQLESLLKDRSENELRLEELKKQREKMIEDYVKEMAKLQHEMYKLYLLNAAMNQNMDKSNPVENLTKQHNKQLQNLDKHYIEVENRLNDIKKTFKETAEGFDRFMKDPASFIDNQ